MSTEEELPLQTIELIKHLEQKYAILVTQVASHSPENPTAQERTPCLAVAITVQ